MFLCYADKRKAQPRSRAVLSLRLTLPVKLLGTEVIGILNDTTDYSHLFHLHAAGDFRITRNSLRKDFAKSQILQNGDKQQEVFTSCVCRHSAEEDGVIRLNVL